MAAAMGNRWTRSALMALTDGSAHIESLRRHLHALAASASSASASSKGSVTSERVGRSEAQCAKVSVPLVWGSDSSSDSARKITFFVKRFPAAKDRRVGQVWLQQGGPGMSGEALDTVAPVLGALLDWRYDIIVPDHRGTGRSTPLQCTTTTTTTTDQEHLQQGGRESLQECFEKLKAEWTEGGLRGFSAQHAARDILHVMRLIRREAGQDSLDEHIVLYGASYGTYVVNSVLRQDKDRLVKAVVADSLVAPPPTFNFVEWDNEYNVVGQEYLQRCDDNKLCSSKMREVKGIINGGDGEDGYPAQAALSSFYDKITSPSKACYAPTDLGLVRRTLSSYLADPDYREFILPLVYREQRCNAKDRVIMDNWNFALGVFNLLFPLAAEQGGPYREDAPSSVALMRYIGGIELSDHRTVSERYVKRAVDTSNPLELQFADGTGYAMWNASKVARDMGIAFEPSKGFAPYTGPTLMLHGDLDPQTPLVQAKKWRERFSDEDDHWVEFPNGQHGAITTTLTIDGSPCAMRIMAEFVVNSYKGEPSKELNTSCVGETISANMDFTGKHRPIALDWFGGDLWDGGPLLSNRNWVRIGVGTVILGLVLLLISVCVCLCVCVGCIVRRRRKAAKRDTFSGVKYSRVDTEVPYDL